MTRLEPMQFEAEAGWPADPVAAVIHPDPYPYYARLAAEAPFHRHDGLGLWVAAGAEAVTEVLTSPACRVRPPADPVPPALAAGPAGALFRRLVRFTDGAAHCPLKQSIVAALDTVDPARLAGAARERARFLVRDLAPQREFEGLNRFIFALPVQTVAILLGVPPERLADIVDRVDALVGAFSPFADEGAVERGDRAADRLLAEFRHPPVGEAETLLGALAPLPGPPAAGHRDLLVANAVGLLVQSYEATAGLIGNTLLSLASDADLGAAVAAQPALTANLIQEVLILDPPTQNTRRFVAEDAILAGAAVRAGDAVLVVLAAAGRDAAAIGAAGSPDLDRPARRIFNFGTGVHACAAGSWAARIAEIAVRALLEAGVDPAPLRAAKRYRRTPNIRAPVFGAWK
jgi:cytochrome P450